MLTRHLWPTVILAAIVLSFGVSDHDSHQRDRTQRAQLVAGCVRTSARTSVLVAAEEDIVRARIKRGEGGEALDAEKLTNGLLATIPSPNERIAGSPELADTQTIVLNGRDVVVPTPRTQSLQRAGCLRVYP